MTRSIEHMPAHIRTKKSWSDTFKASAWSAEDRVFQALVEKMERDEAFAGRVAKMMFGGAA
ncbi:hypothetical protein [Sulfitobacter sp. 20_GPM-1509m]|uniref:hypothetical protein n=1 Tax=Sulfitobacter sp. 20_GPM-1509m TaxID=1380367 RepID=UPI00048D0206|nr:hypothetical protein [Sulfitobacter sp. 20_GPM-1509m]